MSKKQQKQNTKPTTDTLIVEDNYFLSGVENDIKNKNQQTFNSNGYQIVLISSSNYCTFFF